MDSFEKATTVKPLNSHSYGADFPDAWCIGSVPHGGFITAVFLRVARTHFETTLRRQNQPNTLTLHLEFLRRTQTGPATFFVSDIKLGRQASVIHVTLTQGGREEVVGYISNSDLAAEKGLSFTTDWTLNPKPLPVEIPKLKNGTDSHWAEIDRMPFWEFRKASNRVRFFFPRQGQLGRGIVDEWMCLRSGERFTQDSIGFVTDMWPQILETYSDKGDPYDVNKETRTTPTTGTMWYPTLLLNLDVKKVLPPEGVEFLFQRVQAKRIQNGRFDLESVLMDEHGDVVALSHHVVLAVSAGRNLAQRSNEARGNKL
ncbi:MAG: hypothetical protein M1820_006509 [Bogoriella megaspora]|nr:MAG: hypothetical protein M1820_006509 [Bogoriella megaspora]